MKLSQLLKGIPVKEVKGSKELEITGICSNSKLIAPGNLFVARKGIMADGSQYIPEAIASGAVAIVTDLYDPLTPKHITQIIHSDPAEIEGLLAAHYYQRASDEMYMVGLTGTNGKTTTSFLITHLFNQTAGLCGLIGTIEYIIGKTRYKATRTTPDVCSTHKLLREMRLQGCQSAVAEVTSHALDQGRVDQVDFDVALFTNLTLDHLDYHHTMEEYAKAKQKLFLSLDPTKRKMGLPFPKTAIVNADSPWSDFMLQGCKAETLTYGMMGNPDLKATEVVLSPSGTHLTMTYKEERISAFSPFVGRFNVYNYLAAVAVGLARQLPLKTIVEALATATPPPGRLDKVDNPLGLKIYVDFAHSDDALLNVLTCLNEFKTGRIIVVFGCGGNRDASKRPKMGRVCEEHADVVIITSDNPRNESPEAIIDEIKKGLKHPERACVKLDRKEAIEQAISIATPDDLILIAGKGHETYQIFGHKTIEFDDKQVALELCQNRVFA